MRRVIGLVTTGVMALPALAFAQMSASQGIMGVIQLAGRVFNALIGLMILLAIITFFYGVFKYLQDQSGEGKSKSLMMMVRGVIAIFVMVSIWGLVALLQNTFGVQQNTARLPASVPINYGN